MFKAIIYGRNDYPPNVRNYLKMYGNLPIIALVIYRAPIRTMIMKALDYLSNGKVSALPYDKLFHLSLKVTLQNGINLIVEKNEVINIAPFKAHEDAEIMPITNVPKITLNELLDNCRKVMGPKFFTYQANANNCQHFIMNILHANNMLNESYRAFIKQDTASIFQNNPTLRKFANTTTDIAGRFDVIKQGAGKKTYLTVRL